ncbi:MAG: hypothetical protein LIO99_10140 [Clostridiales bacterium]|nr:hypothetical protein [Clostridiales bacterium]
MSMTKTGKKITFDKYDKFGEMMPDGRLTEPSDGKKYHLRKAISLTKELGRPLTQDEMRKFEI